jgi:hypothetical protein
MEIPKFKCRASQMGVLMTNGRGKDAGMGQTAKSYLYKWVIEQMTGISEDIQNKYFDHGNYAEQAVLDRASKYYDCKFVKNETQLENDFFTGTFDSMSSDLVIDAKAPFSPYTMPYFEDSPDKAYYYQLQTYMALTGLNKASLVYGLENHSKDSIERMAWKIAKKQDPEADDIDIEHWNQAKAKLTYDHLPDWMRIKVYEFDRDDELITQMQNRVVEARQFIETEILPKLAKQITVKL